MLDVRDRWCSISAGIRARSGRNMAPASRNSAPASRRSDSGHRRCAEDEKAVGSGGNHCVFPVHCAIRWTTVIPSCTGAHKAGTQDNKIVYIINMHLFNLYF